MVKVPVFPGRKIWPRVLLGAAMVLHIILCAGAARLETPTVDEFAHVPAGLAYWKHGSLDLYSKNPPLLKLWMTLPLALGMGPKVNVPVPQGNPLGWGPWQYGSQFEAANNGHYFQIFLIARLMVIFFSVGTALILFYWSRRLWGEGPAALASCGFLLAPTVLAHGHLATTDAGGMFFIALFAFVLGRRKGVARAALGGGLLGLAMAAKFTAILLLPWLVIQGARNKKPVLCVLTSLLTCLLVINICYGFKNTGRALGSYSFSSTFMTRVKSLLPAAVPLPMPGAFVTGFDAQKADTENGEFGSYLFGKWSRDGWWYYTPVAFLMKANAVTLLLLLGVPAAFIFLKPELSELLALTAPLLFLGIPLALSNKLQIGVRYLLALYPFLFVSLAAVFAAAFKKFQKNPKIPLALAGLCLLMWTWTAVGTFPSYISYFNPLALKLGEKPQLLLDSNLDWGQDLYRLKGINERLNGGQPIGLLYFGHVSPSLYGIEFQLIPSRPVKGILAVSANFLEGYPYLAPAPDGNFVAVPAAQVEWLKAYKPVERDGSIYVYDTRETGSLQ